MKESLQHMDDLTREIEEIAARAGRPDYDPYKKERERAAKLFPETTPNAFTRINPNERRNAGEIGKRLFGDLWRIGEVAVLCGPPGVGKSLLAVQIAESIARGLDDPSGTFHTPAPRRVSYLDLGNYHTQFRLRYGRYRFSKRLERLEIDTDADIPPAFANRNEHILHYFFHAIDAGPQPRVVVVDAASYLPSRGMTSERIMRGVRFALGESDVSLLLVINSRTRKKPQAATLDDLPPASIAFAEHADSVFALGASTIDPRCRYLKHLKSRTEPLPSNSAASPVHTFCIQSTERPWGLQAREGTGIISSHVGLEAAQAGQVQPSALRAMSRHGAQFRLSPSEGEYPGFLYMGLAPECEHLRDYTAEAERQLRSADPRQMKTITPGRDRS